MTQKVRRQRRQPTHTDSEAALLYGWLREVNWDKGTAQLHDATGNIVRLSFDASFGEEMQRLATQYVEVHGQGTFKGEDWQRVAVEKILETRASEPLDLEAFRDNPNAKVFDPASIVTIDLSEEEWQAFDQAIREGRDA